MYNKTIILLYWLLFLGSSYSVEFPSSFQKCDRKQSDFEQCLATAVTDALQQLNKPIPDVGLPAIEPFITSVTSIPPGKIGIFFTQNYKNFTLHGLSTGKVTKFGLNFEEKTINLKVFFEDISATFDYNFDGKLLVVPIRGGGPGKIVANNMTFDIKFTLEEYENDEKKYFKVINTELNLIEPEKLTFNFGNLARTDLNLGLGGLVGLHVNVETVDPNVIFNQNAINLFHDVKGGYESVLASDFGAVFNKLLEKVSISDLFGEK